ncbi:MAG: tRNA (adenosine(37)-N6)-threonylcarbamoyltransferase complex ATPase subunit type 1 TsaE [Mariprofundales bacterium]
MLFYDEQQMVSYANSFARQLRVGDVVALSGELGAGKSVFARAVMRSLGVQDRIMPSPTFSFIQTYTGKTNTGEECQLAHMDWYRLDNAEEIELLGVREYFMPPWICLIEWPERASELLPHNHQYLRLSILEIQNSYTGRRLSVVQQRV